MNKRTAVSAAAKSRAVDRIAEVLLDLASRVPRSAHRVSSVPDDRARTLILKAGTKAAMVSGALAVPPGPLGLLTVLPITTIRVTNITNTCTTG